MLTLPNKNQTKKERGRSANYQPIIQQTIKRSTQQITQPSPKPIMQHVRTQKKMPCFLYACSDDGMLLLHVWSELTTIPQ